MTAEPRRVASSETAPEPPPAPAPPALELRDVTVGYGRAIILRDVSLTVPAGSVVELLGPNGGGKTTLLRTGAGLLRPRTGDVFCLGTTVTRAAPNKRARAGMCLIPEGRGIFRSLTVRENLRVFAGAQGGSGNMSEVIERAIAVFPALTDRMGDIAGRLSGGQQQMLALARAYLGQARVVMLDEVSMGLAPRIVDEIFESLHRLKAEGHSVLLVEQYVHKALEMSDYVYVLARGQIVYHKPAAGVDPEAIHQQYLGRA